MELDEIKKILQNHEERISVLEGCKKENKPSKEKAASDYSGLNGGIQMLIDEQYFESPQSTQNVIKKLNEKGYHYEQAVVAKALANYFMKRDRKLTRIKEKVWKYAIRK